ncbi:MAG: methylmalonyl Co-A mutase-associated GTPase MeaB [Hyphomicrobiaceae bacterium]
MTQAAAVSSPDDSVAAVRRGDRRALAAAVTTLERGGAGAQRLLEALGADVGRSHVIGITGPPGAGKSALVNALIRAWRASGVRVGVIAVDPSSPVSGGAILGDRIRMSAALDDDGVYVRSLASQGHMGGLSPAAVRVIDALDAGGFEIVLIETVGTGQTEIDVAEVADVRVVVAAPGLGDGIQAMKSGILEIADVLVVNKADREGAARTRQELDAALALRASSKLVPVIETVATLGRGVDDLVGAIGRQLAALPPPEERRRGRARYLIVRAAMALVQARVKAAGGEVLDGLAAAVLAGALAPDAAARRLLDGMEDTP